MPCIINRNITSEMRKGYSLIFVAMTVLAMTVYKMDLFMLYLLWTHFIYNYLVIDITL